MSSSWLQYERTHLRPQISSLFSWDNITCWLYSVTIPSSWSWHSLIYSLPVHIDIFQICIFFAQILTDWWFLPECLISNQETSRTDSLVWFSSGNLFRGKKTLVKNYHITEATTGCVLWKKCFANFTEKYLCWNLFLIKLQA